MYYNNKALVLVCLKIKFNISEHRNKRKEGKKKKTKKNRKLVQIDNIENYKYTFFKILNVS